MTAEKGYKFIGDQVSARWSLRVCHTWSVWHRLSLLVPGHGAEPQPAVHEVGEFGERLPSAT